MTVWLYVSMGINPALGGLQYPHRNSRNTMHCHCQPLMVCSSRYAKQLMWTQLLMPATQAQETCTRNLCEKLAWKIWRKFITVSCTKTTLHRLRPITLHGLCHVPNSFCSGTELCSTACKKFVPEKNMYTCKFLVQDDLHKFLVLQRVSRALGHVLAWQASR